ncbi:MAG: SWIM zinc finger family protein [Crocinitomix sp.]|nr:SWIM zinc finger family protein [Crocinitomix sp.]
MISTDFEYSYDTPSRFSDEKLGKEFLLSHCSEIQENSNENCFFYGNIIDSYIVSKCLSALSKTVRSHFALARGVHLSLRDPIVSVGNKQLKFEGFSSCNGVYARVDIKPKAIDGEFLFSGSTNVDFNNETVRAFNTVKKDEKLILGVGAKELDIITESKTTKEKKVSLPDKWIKGLGNVQVYLSEMELVCELTKVEAIMLLKSVPKSIVKDDFYLTKEGNRYKFTPSVKKSLLKFGAIHRLHLITHLLPHINSFNFYKDKDDQSVALILDFKNVQMLFLFSAGAYRGFSGEGRNAENFALNIPDEYLVGINNVFKANDTFNPTLLAVESDIDLSLMNQSHAYLSSIGLLGYDLVERNHFYRRLPFKLKRLRNLNPRYKNAQKLIDQKNIKILSNSDGKLTAEVKGTAGVVHKVILTSQAGFCTCTWFTKNKTNRGLCKHILAVKLLTSEEV